MIECINLTHSYGNRQIYRDLSFHVERGRIMGLLGKNGTGKTTTINLISGFMRPQSGQCKVMGCDVQHMDPKVRQRIGLLIENHVQYTFMTIEQIERFYSHFYPQWDKKVYYDLVSLLHVAPQQKISTMSCGQRSQIALALLMAQDPDLLVLDDFSIGLDPGYRRLFIEYLFDFVKSRGKTAFLTSHIIQDMERLIDDCIILDYGSILLQKPVDQLLSTYYQYSFRTPHLLADLDLSSQSVFYPSQIRDRVELGSFLSPTEMHALLRRQGIGFVDLEGHRVGLEDVFIGLTGKY